MVLGQFDYNWGRRERFAFDVARQCRDQERSGRIDPVRLRPIVLSLVRIVGCLLAVISIGAGPGSAATEQPSDIPSWLKLHVGEGDGQIAPVVLQRARALYQQKMHAGIVKNPCYFAMDATRPHDLGDGRLGKRFYMICEAEQSFRAFSSGHGGGHKVKGVGDFGNGKRCAKNFGNALDSRLTAGGAYVTRETRTSFKGYYRISAAGDALLVRSFVQFEGEGETANAREREIGGHPAALLRNVCRRKNPNSSYADHDGYVLFGQLEEYAGGRSNGCTSWSPVEASDIIAKMKDNPTTLYIYPEAADIDAVAQAVAGGRSPASAGLYWNASCLRDIRAPKFWHKEAIEPLLAHDNKDKDAPPPPERPLPICKGK
jgi:hypothetical protein